MIHGLLKKKKKDNNTNHELNEISVLLRKKFLNIKMKPHSNVILLFKNSGTNMEDDSTKRLEEVECMVVKQ